MPRRPWGTIVLAIVLASAGCVEVPDTIRAEFAGPGPQDPSNYRPGTHGKEPPVAKANPPSEDASMGDAEASGEAGAAPEDSADGGVEDAGQADLDAGGGTS